MKFVYFPPTFRVALWFFKRKIKYIKCDLQQSIMNIHCQFDFIVDDIDLDHQVEVVSLSFLRCMCIVFFPHTCVVLFRRKPHPWGWNIYTNLEFSYNNYLVFFLLNLLFIHLLIYNHQGHKLFILYFEL